MKNTLEIQLNKLFQIGAGSDDVFLVNDDGEFSFRQVFEKVELFSRFLDEVGLQRGDRLVYRLDKSVNQACLIIACYWRGIVFVPLLPNQSDANVAHIITDCDPSLIVVDSDLNFGFYKSINITEIIDFCDKLEGRKNLVLSNLMQDDLAAIIYSSGSTGRPKGICFSRRNISDGAEIVAEYTGISADDVILSPLSLNFDYGLNQVWVSILKKCKLILHEFTYSTAFMRLIDELKPTVIPLMPVFIGSITDPRLRNKMGHLSGRSVRLITTSGGAVSQSFQNNILDMFPNADLMLMYGLTEAFRSTFLDPTERVNRVGSVGKAIPGARVWVGDEKFNTLPPYEVGKIYHEGGCISLGYWKQPEANAERFCPHPDFPNRKILVTGDLGYQDEEGFLYFAGRADTMIKTRGHRVSPYEIEQEVMKLSGIKSVVVTSVPDELLTNSIILAYVADNSLAISDQELKVRLSQLLPSHQVPDLIFHFEEFPTTGNQGKIDVRSVHESCLMRLENAKNV
ncbi:AMP-binding protein [Planktomarina temperata]|nr:AMP-binding protein [Planktomarina temperata]